MLSLLTPHTTSHSLNSFSLGSTRFTSTCPPGPAPGSWHPPCHTATQKTTPCLQGQTPKGCHAEAYVCPPSSCLAQLLSTALLPCMGSALCLQGLSHRSAHGPDRHAPQTTSASLCPWAAGAAIQTSPSVGGHGHPMGDQHIGACRGPLVQLDMLLPPCHSQGLASHLYTSTACYTLCQSRMDHLMHGTSCHMCNSTATATSEHTEIPIGLQAFSSTGAPAPWPSGEL